MQAIMAINNSPSPVSSDSFPENDNLPQFAEDAETIEDILPELNGKRKSRRPPSTAERRANHNAVERARRESLNGRFMDLAGALPNMASVKRPSKSVIVAKSLEFVQGAQAREQYLLSQNDALRQEINDLRLRLGIAPLSNSPVGMAQATALPMVNAAARQRKASSVSSSNGTDSPHMSTPSSLGSFEASPATANFTFNSAYANAFPAPSNPPPAQNIDQLPPPKDNNSTPTPATMAPYTRPSPALDVNYLMALSMQQQQQQQNLMQMGNHIHQQPQYAPWLMPRHAAPVAAGGDSHWFIN